jgi:hypothetical protein
VKVAELLGVTPVQGPLRILLISYPFQVVGTFVNVRVEVVAPLTSPPLGNVCQAAEGLVLNCHVKAGAEPEAATVKVAFPPHVAVVLAGCVVKAFCTQG